MRHSFFQRQLAKLIDLFLSFLTIFITGVYPQSPDKMPTSPQNNVYYANHSSHGDFLLIWVSLPKRWRMSVHPVAAADYWLKNFIRRFLIHKVFNGLLVERKGKGDKSITEKMHQTLVAGKSLIIFPEGTRNMDNPLALKPFKGGIYYLAKYDTARKFIPMWISNMNFVLPKGHFLPVPLLCRVNIGEAITLQENESKEDFIKRCHQALLALAPQSSQSIEFADKEVE